MRKELPEPLKCPLCRKRPTGPFHSGESYWIVCSAVRSTHYVRVEGQTPRIAITRWNRRPK
jgi:hypothetical protein